MWKIPIVKKLVSSSGRQPEKKMENLVDADVVVVAAGASRCVVVAVVVALKSLRDMSDWVLRRQPS